MKKLLLLTFIITTSLAISCSKKDPEPRYGCEGDTELTVTHVQAVYQGNGFFTFDAGAPYGASGAWACKVDSGWVKSDDPKKTNYIISGNIKKVRFIGPTLIAVYPPIEITAIHKN
ncbi:hypothetical protein LZD49_05265 [Dyadobacter sp. CY261]|uniref:hypothetical protein n=1 Tax=Dyadobacter sp. CY261 TaxID=2907203 RepID=UPI001F188B0A|nr:hypothetical protein [Dyadobacter sp. CY261]MCF0069871.1 hypothetical protein [Dyadobacter sp. CY261]